MQPITADQIAKAVDGRFMAGSPETVVSSVSINSREIAPGALFVPIVGERVDAHQFIPAALEAGAAATLTQKALTTAPQCCCIQVKDTKEALQALARWYRGQFTLPVVGITGSVGKSTTKEMVASALSGGKKVLKTAGNYNSQLGLPLMIFQIENSYDAAVLEMGMSDFGEMARLSAMAKPSRAVVTNIGTSHIGQLGSRENIRSEKLHIADYLGDTGTAFLNGDDDMLAPLRGQLPYRCQWYGRSPACDWQARDIQLSGSSISFSACYQSMQERFHVPAVGMHNVYNALAAVAVAWDMGLSMAQIRAGLAGYQGLSMRQQIFEAGGIRVIDDSYNSSPDALKSSLDVLVSLAGQGRPIAVLADMLELGEISAQAHEACGRYAAQIGVQALITVGNQAAHLARGAQEENNALEVHQCANNQEAFAQLQRIAQSGDIVLVKGSRGMKTDEIVSAIRQWKGQID